MEAENSDTRMDEAELVNLLDNALKDFKKTKSSDDDLDDLMSNFDRENMQKAASNFNKMLEDMIRQQNTAKSANNVTETTASVDQEAQFIESINKFLQQNKSAINASDDKSFMDALKNVDEKNPAVDELMGAILHTALSRDVMYPAVKEMHEKFGVYLAEKKDVLNEEQLAQYLTQNKIIGELCKVYEGEDISAEQQSVQISKLWLDLQKVGLPPPEITGSMTGEGSDEIFSSLTGDGRLSADCSIM